MRKADFSAYCNKWKESFEISLTKNSQTFIHSEAEDFRRGQIRLRSSAGRKQLKKIQGGGFKNGPYTFPSL